MSELITACPQMGIRWQLLATVSALALTTYVASNSAAKAEDGDRPTVWIELGGQLSHLQDGQDAFAPALMAGRPSIFYPSQKFEKPPSDSFDGTGSISIQPDHSAWVFSASVKYGRSKSRKHEVQQTSPLPTPKYGVSTTVFIQPLAQKFADTKAQNSETHAILDFEAGKDIGLGMFGSQSTSLVSVGIRFAQFSSNSNFALKSDPDWHFGKKYASYPPFLYHAKLFNQPFHSNLASLTAERNFHGVGPSVSWKSSIPVIGNAQGAEIAIDWGLNAAILFGRQKTRTHHQSTARYGYGKATLITSTGTVHTTAQFPATPDHTRSRSVIVPNIGGFAGLSFKYPNAKVSFGYRADFFFGAMDTGIDARNTSDVGFHGPYASVSIGMGG